MSRVVLVRHGQASARWDEELDPGLDAVGREQAEATAAQLATASPERGGGHARPKLVTSPLRRARETAAALERRWAVEAHVEPRLGEIPSPSLELTQRGAWLGELMRGSWGSAEPAALRWRADVIECLRAIEGDTVAFTHFIAINVAVGAATGDDRVVGFAPANGSCTVLDVESGRLALVSLGLDAAGTAVR